MVDVTLKFEFGGLCLFVRDDSGSTPHSIYALLPKMTMNITPHCPTLLVYRENQVKTDLYSLGATDIDLTRLLTTTPADTRTVFNFALDMTWCTGGKKIPRSWLTSSFDGDLGARIRLPSNTTFDASPFPTANIGVENVGSAMPTGRVAVTVTIPGYASSVVQVGPATVNVADLGKITFYVLNVRRCDIKHKKQRHHSAGDELKHLRAYYSLLDNATSRPRLTVNQTVDGDNSLCPPEPCYHGHHVIDFVPPEAKYAKADRDALPWVDTHDCALGTGTLE